MKTSLLVLALLATPVLAQLPGSSLMPPQIRRLPGINSTQGAEATPAFSENYLVTLSVTEDGKPITELVIATARADFKADCVDPTVTFLGNLSLSEDGTVLLSYSLGAEVVVRVPKVENAPDVAAKPASIQYKTQSAQGEVRLRLGEPMNVLKTGARTYRLTVAKLPAGAAKEP